MKYLCLMYLEEKLETHVSRDQIEQGKRDHWAFVENIKKSGHLVATNVLKHGAVGLGRGPARLGVKRPGVEYGRTQTTIWDPFLEERCGICA